MSVESYIEDLLEVSNIDWAMRTSAASYMFDIFDDRTIYLLKNPIISF